MRAAGKRSLYFLLGVLALLLGIIGIILPLVPTVPFILLALWAFARSSQRMHTWLHKQKITRKFLGNRAGPVEDSTTE